MKSVRLTDRLRNQILRAMLAKAKFQSKKEKIKKREEALFLTLRDFTLGKNKGAYLSLPGKLQQHELGIQITSVPGHHWEHVSSTQRQPCPIKRIIFGDLNKSIQTKLIKLLDDRAAVDAEDKEIRRKAKSVLASCSSTKQLIESMPEAKEFLPEDLAKNLPIVSKETVNELRAALKAA